MWLTKLLVLTLPTITIGLRWDTLDISINYFKERNVPYVCLISCGNVAWDVEFTKAAASRFISVTKLDEGRTSYNTMEQCFRQQFSNIGVLMNAQCDNVEQILYIASEKRWLDMTHIWLIVDETTDLGIPTNTSTVKFYSDLNNSSRVMETLSNINVSVDADIIIASRRGDKFKLYDVFNFGKEQGGGIVVTNIGTWRPGNNEFIQELNRCKYYRRWDFKQGRMRIVSVLTSKTFNPDMLISVNPVSGVSTITRTSTIILAEVAKLHNIKFIYTKSDKWLGIYERNASRAASTSIYFREQDVTSVFRFHETLFGRVTLIHPSTTFIESRYFYRIPTTGPGKFENQFLRPLSAGTWYCLLLVSLACTIVVVLASRLEARPASVQYALFSVAASVCQQCFEDDAHDSALRRISADSSFRVPARRLTMFVTALACVLIYNYYTSSVVSWLLNGPPPSINSLQELLESPLELIFEDVGYMHSWLTIPGYYFNSHNAKYEDIMKERVLNKKRKTPIFVPLEQGVAMVKAGGYAYLTEPFQAYPLISRSFDQSELCELDSLTSIDKVLLYPGVQKNSPYKEFLTWSLTRMLERGIVSCVQRRTAPPPVACGGSSPRALALGGAAPAFILLAAGYMVATAIMLLERFVYKMKERSQCRTPW